MERIEINILKGIKGRLEEISEILAVNFDTVINVALFEGFPLIWGKITEALDAYVKFEVSKEEKDKNIQEIWGILANHLEDTYARMKEIEAIQEDFQEIYSEEDFHSLKELNKAFSELVSASKRKNEER